MLPDPSPGRIERDYETGTVVMQEGKHSVRVWGGAWAQRLAPSASLVLGDGVSLIGVPAESEQRGGDFGRVLQGSR